MKSTSKRNNLLLPATLGAMLIAVSLVISMPVDASNEDHVRDNNTLNKSGDKHKQPENAVPIEKSGVRFDPKALKEQGVIIEILRPKKLVELLQTNAEVRYNERRRVALTARSSGWAENVSVFANQRVKKNQLLAKIYSPEFLSAQHEYLLIFDRATHDGAENIDNQSLLADARQRLQILGLTPSEIDKLSQTRKPFSHQHVHSPISGIVVEHKLTTGDTVIPGQQLYVIASLRTVWAELALTEMQLAKVQRGQKVTLSTKAYPGGQFHGKVLSVGAQMDETTRTVKARALIRNPRGRLKPGMFATAEIAVGVGLPTLALPESAVLRSPDGDWVVFVEAKPGYLEPVEIEVVRTVESSTIIKGLKPGTRVVTKGAFFIQSELAKSGFEVHNH
ncbi:MAG: efflux RND transporter periplasmic adaptor subunit [Acidiferrobacterales bacterium]